MTACIHFDGSLDARGYGRTQFLGRQYLAHRLAFALNELLHPDALRGRVIRHVPRSHHANQRALARRYGVTQSEISHIVTGARWAHSKDKK